MGNNVFHGYYLSKDDKYTTVEAMLSFFYNFMKTHLSLMEFYMRFKCVFAQQRHSELYTYHVNEY